MVATSDLENTMIASLVEERLRKIEKDALRRKEKHYVRFIHTVILPNCYSKHTLHYTDDDTSRTKKHLFETAKEKLAYYKDKANGSLVLLVVGVGGGGGGSGGGGGGGGGGGVGGGSGGDAGDIGYAVVGCCWLLLLMLL